MYIFFIFIQCNFVARNCLQFWYFSLLYIYYMCQQSKTVGFSYINLHSLPSNYKWLSNKNDFVLFYIKLYSIVASDSADAWPQHPSPSIYNTVCNTILYGHCAVHVKCGVAYQVRYMRDRVPGISSTWRGSHIVLVCTPLVRERRTTECVVAQTKKGTGKVSAKQLRY